MTWRELITQYLVAAAGDDSERLQSELADQRHQFLATHGTQRFSDFENERLQTRGQKLELPPLSPHSYVVVCEQDDLIIAEVSPGPNAPCEIGVEDWGRAACQHDLKRCLFRGRASHCRNFRTAI